MQLNEISANYDKAASYYDKMTDLVFHSLLRVEKNRELMIDQLGDIEGKRVLDIGCGTGRNFELLVERVGPQGQIHGIDYSKGMLEEARNRVNRRGWDNVKLSHDDAVELKTTQPPYDAIVSAWCLGIVYDLEKALSKALSLLKPEGHIAIMDFQRAHPDRGPLRWLFPIYSHFLQAAGIDSSEDLNDAHLQQKWREGLSFLQTNLQDVHYQTYLQNMGFIVSGKLS